MTLVFKSFGYLTVFMPKKNTHGKYRNNDCLPQNKDKKLKSIMNQKINQAKRVLDQPWLLKT